MKQNSKPRLLIYAHYYVPDVASTGQILKEVAEGLLDTFEITVICVVPSYGGRIAPQYKEHKYYKESWNGVKLIRVRVPEFHKSDKLSRVKNILTYFFRAMTVTGKAGKMDYIFAISQPPILGGLLGVWGKWTNHAKYIYNIQDFNPEQIMAVDYSKSSLLTGVLMAADKFSCGRSDLVITVGRDLVKTVEDRFTKKGVVSKKMPKVALINNWIDERNVYPLNNDNEKVSAFKRKYELENKFVFMYSGNIGLYYDLENLIRVMGRFSGGTQAADGREAVFAFVGDGGMLEELKSYKKDNNLENVIFIPYQQKENLIYSLNAADVHWVVNAKGIKGVSCPSKFYGVAAVSKPVLGVLESGSEIRCIIEESGCGLCVVPGDYKGVEEMIQWFLERSAEELNDMGANGRKYLIEHLTREISIEKYKEAILDV